MSTQRTDNDAKRMGGYLKEKWTIGMSRVSSDELQRALIKVTSHKLKVPNEKHLERLISATHGNINTGSNQYDDVPGFIVTELEGHTHSRNWVVVLKTLIVYHELMNQGSDKMLQSIASHRQPFNTAHMKDLADSPDGAMQEGFVHAYARYLEERCVTIASCRLQTRIESEEFLQHYLEISAASAAPVTAALLLQLEVLLNVDLRESALNNHATMHAFKRVVEDGRRLYAVLTRRMAAMLEGFVDYTHPDQKVWLQLFTRYQQATKKLADLFVRMNALPSIDFGSQLPTLKTMPDSIIVQLENYMLDGGDDNGSSNVAVSRLDRSAESGGGGATRSKSPELFKRKLTSGESQSPQASSPFAIATAGAAAAAAPAGASGLSASATAPAAMSPQQQQAAAAKADPLGDLFGGATQPPVPARAVSSPPPPAGLATNSAPAAPQQQQHSANAMDDLFAPAAPKQAAPLPPQQQPQQQQQQQRPAGSNNADFDPFAPAPASQWQSASPPPAAGATRSPPPPQAAGIGGGGMDFFATGASQQPAGSQQQQQRRANTTTSGTKPHGDDQLDFFAASSSKPAPAGGNNNNNNNGKSRAW